MCQSNSLSQRKLKQKSPSNAISNNEPLCGSLTVYYTYCLLFGAKMITASFPSSLCISLIFAACHVDGKNPKCVLLPDLWDCTEQSRNEHIYLDYREYLGPARNQGKKCEACWAFSSTSGIEGAIAKLTNGQVKVELSEQLLIDCIARDKDPCEPKTRFFTPRKVFEYLNSGKIKFATRKSYPYVGMQHPECRRYDKVTVDYRMLDSGVARNPTQEEIIALLERYGPVLAEMEMTQSFEEFKGKRVYRGQDCSATRNVNHLVTIVGYGVSADDEPFWLIRNSHGTKWGDRGHVRFLRGSNVCFVESLIWWFTGQKADDQTLEDISSVDDDRSLFHI
ncbi:hypothetical protein L596_020065 [Steinernema carpocapsae]|uniref:Peptidase C1A papain C-terminal domain-containing protein n=1 Tax=Steinernema carpocapsae TaxID=34508 RepID=A0A4U5MSH6_STECR|nr:hypothetical protein L596_020065 [Steinernema carpocapsae]